MPTSIEPPPSRWQLLDFPMGIAWAVSDAGNPANVLPHADHVEMSGRRLSVIVRYSLDARRRLFVERDIIWPQLRLREGDVRGYLRRRYDDYLILPRIVIDGKEWNPLTAPVAVVIFNGNISFRYDGFDGIEITRMLSPDRIEASVTELWRIDNRSEKPISIQFLDRTLEETDSGVHGDYNIVVGTKLQSGSDPLSVGVDEYAEFALSFQATITSSRSEPDRLRDAIQPLGKTSRIRLASDLQGSPRHLAFRCPDPVLNQAFAFAKLRAAESLFETSEMGLVHSPGGGNYYGGIWANDQCEYANPLFAFLNDADAHEASVNSYRHYYRAMQERPDFTKLPTSFEMEGTIPYQAGGDRGDAAMIASGLSRYLLVRGDRDLATELFPAVEWCVEYCRRQTDERGIVLSDTDELEGRFPTGDANLSTSSLAYDGYRRGTDLARSLGHLDIADDWNSRADALAIGIEAFFGSTVAGFPTYRYYDGNTTLRSWICLPLVFDLARGDRKAGTLAALFSPLLWTPDGLATEAGDKVFWDRSTLYGLRGAFAAGATEAAFAHLTEYSRRRLLGDHVPYPVESYPENAQAHLSAESALYCRVFTEGLLGIVPTRLDSFSLTPRLPAAWPEYSLQFTAFGDRDIHIQISRAYANTIRTTVTVAGVFVCDVTADEGATHSVELP